MALHVCTNCGTAYAPAPECPQCGADHWVDEQQAQDDGLFENLNDGDHESVSPDDPLGLKDEEDEEPELISVADQKAAGIPADETVTIADQKAGVDPPVLPDPEGGQGAPPESPSPGDQAAAASSEGAGSAEGGADEKGSVSTDPSHMAMAGQGAGETPDDQPAPSDSVTGTAFTGEAGPAVHDPSVGSPKDGPTRASRTSGGKGKGNRA
jgi:predicted  nucleic acid-binding Zn-ribbon protein